MVSLLLVCSPQHCFVYVSVGVMEGERREREISPFSYVLLCSLVCVFVCVCVCVFSL